MKKKKIINTIILIIWCIFIFIMSSFNADYSNDQSNFVINVFSNIFDISNISNISYIIRKLAHFCEYFILVILVVNCFKCYKVKPLYIYSVVFSIIYACTDEFHQLFISGRSGEFIDIGIDSLGILMGAFIYYFLKNKTKS